MHNSKETEMPHPSVVSRRKFLIGSIAVLGDFFSRSILPDHPTNNSSASDTEPDIEANKTGPEWKHYKEIEQAKRGFYYVINPSDTFKKITDTLNQYPPFSNPKNTLSVQQLLTWNPEILNPDILQPGGLIFIMPPESSEITRVKTILEKQQLENDRRKINPDSLPINFEIDQKTEILKNSTIIQIKLDNALTPEQAAERYGVNVEDIKQALQQIGLPPLTDIPKGTKLILPAEKGIYLTEEDKEKNKKWIPNSDGINSESYIWLTRQGKPANKTGYPNWPYTYKLVTHEYFPEGSTSTATFWYHDFVPLSISPQPITQQISTEGGIPSFSLVGFKTDGVYIKKRVEQVLVPAGQWQGEGLIPIDPTKPNNYHTLFSHV